MIALNPLVETKFFFAIINPRELLATRATILWLAQMSPHLIKRYCPPEAITCQSNTGTKARRKRN